MTKSELIAALAEATELNKTKVELVLDALATVVSHDLALGETVTLPGIVKLVPKEREACTGRNPRTGEPVEIAAKTVITAKVVPSLARALA